MFHARTLTTALTSAAPDIAPFGALVDVRESVGSTNDEASRLALAGAPEGALVVAHEQTLGRGRRGARWQSPPGAGLYVSVVLRPSTWPAAEQQGDRLNALITLMAGVAAVDALRRCGAGRAELKWPNDVIVRSGGNGDASDTAGRPPWRKLAGVLAEGATVGRALHHVIVGIGINVRRAVLPADLTRYVTTLEEQVGAAGVPADAAVLVALLRALSCERARLAAGQTDATVSAWRKRSPTSCGWDVSWDDGERRRSGVTASVDDHGALLVDTSEGRARVVSGTLNWTGGSQ